MTLPGRADFHREHEASAKAQAQQLFAQKATLQAAWLNWVAAQLDSLRPPAYANMVRRELAQLQASAGN